MLSNLVEQACTYAGEVDSLFSLITIVVGFWFIVAEVVLFAFIFGSRRKKDKKAAYISGEEKSQKKWVNIPHALVLVCDVVLIVGAIKVWYHIKQNLPPAESTVRVVAQQWAWTFVHPGPDGEIDTEDDVSVVDELHLKNDTLYHFKLESKDVVHSFSVPVFRLKQDAIPGRTITGWFEPNRTGEYDIQCAEICGIGHGVMAARLFVEDAKTHSAWLARVAPPESGALALAAHTD